YSPCLYFHCLFSILLRPPPRPPLFPYTTLFRSPSSCRSSSRLDAAEPGHQPEPRHHPDRFPDDRPIHLALPLGSIDEHDRDFLRSEEHTSELQSRGHLVCRLLLEKKNNN